MPWPGPVATQLQKPDYSMRIYGRDAKFVVQVQMNECKLEFDITEAVKFGAEDKFTARSHLMIDMALLDKLAHDGVYRALERGYY